MEQDKYAPLFSNAKTYQIFLTDGYSCFVSADTLCIDEKGFITLTLNGTIQAVFISANIAGYRIA